MVLSVEQTWVPTNTSDWITMLMAAGLALVLDFLSSYYPLMSNFTQMQDSLQDPYYQVPSPSAGLAPPLECFSDFAQSYHTGIMLFSYYYQYLTTGKVEYYEILLSIPSFWQMFMSLRTLALSCLPQLIPSQMSTSLKISLEQSSLVYSDNTLLSIVSPGRL